MATPRGPANFALHVLEFPGGRRHSDRVVGTFFLTSLLIELIDPKKDEQTAHTWADSDTLESSVHESMLLFHEATNRRNGDHGVLFGGSEHRIGLHW